MESIDYDRLMRANAARVFSERDPARRLDAIRELYTAGAVVTEPEGVAKGEAAISDAVTELLSKLPPAFAFTPTGPAIGHHGVGRLLWKGGPPNGPPAATGMDLAHFKDGRIQALYVLLDPAPLAEVQSTVRSRNMNNDNVTAVRNAYAVAERKDLEGWISSFTPDGVFTDNSIGASYRGRALADPVRNYGAAFSNMHRELYRIYSDGDVVVVQLALQGTHDGPLQLPFGELRATGKQMDAPCCDVFELEGGKIKRFDCYPEGSVILVQLGVLNNLDAALSH